MTDISNWQFSGKHNTDTEVTFTMNGTQIEVVPVIGFWDGVKKLFKDIPTLLASNIKSGITILGILGTYEEAATGDNVSGGNGLKQFDIPNAKYSGKHATANDTNLTATNIKKDTTIFGVTGTFEGEGGSAGLPTTGQTTSYEDYDDGYYQAGVAPTGRFTDNDDGTVTDNSTSLMHIRDVKKMITGTPAAEIPENVWNTWTGQWQATTMYFVGNLTQNQSDNKFYVCLVEYESGEVSFDDDLSNSPENWHEIVPVWFDSANPNNPKKYDWVSFLALIDALSYAGQSDWRMPNAIEAVSIVDFSKNSGYRFYSAFESENETYFTSTTNAYNTADCWGVRSALSEPNILEDTDKAGSHLCRPVRGGNLNE